MLENDTSRQELIDQLRKVAATPPQDPVPAIAPPEAEEEKNGAGKRHRHQSPLRGSPVVAFCPALSQLVGTSHKPFNPHTFSAAATQFAILAGAVFIFYWLLRLSVWPLYRKMGQWGRKKNQHKSSWLHLPAMITGAFVIDLLLLALTLFVGQLLADRLNTGNKTIAFQQGLFLNAFALIEFFKALLRLIFCPRVPDLRPFAISDQSAKYWAVRLSVLSGLIGYGLLVAVPIISNQLTCSSGRWRTC